MAARIPIWRNFRYVTVTTKRRFLHLYGINGWERRGESAAATGTGGMTCEMPHDRPYAPRDYAEDDLLPARSAPQPLCAGPGRTDSHPLLDISLTPDKGGGILRKDSSERRRGRRQVRFEVSNEPKPGLRSVQHEGPSAGPLEVPRMHSSEVLRQEVRRESQQEFDAERAVQSELGRSYRARRSVESEAARALNVGRVHSLYQGLVSVEPPAEQIQRLTEKQRKPSDLKQVTSSEGPDLSAFSGLCERFTETPYLGVEGLPPLAAAPRPRPSRCSFDMFHKLGQWAS
ncbi:protein phosphatase 1 regulatory subunit 35 [Spea bombifrons]|uniref:protein phosphatase 1 regulatory subunit 35 n=1 Tax=Spea bombifrons TaxID=233779 RepID=UPI002348EF5B|nr:protein phosphatase 1 regulatory subunit 35 [Spea bombifrons]